MVIQVGQRTKGPANDVDIGYVGGQDQNGGRRRRQAVESGSAERKACQGMSEVIQRRRLSVA
jgi:hypothetical protein